jgi:hypothetical protein
MKQQRLASTPAQQRCRTADGGPQNSLCVEGAQLMLWNTDIHCISVYDTSVSQRAR